METVIKFKEQLSSSQLKMAIEVLKAIGLSVVEENNIVELDQDQKEILATRLKNINEGNFKTKEEAYKIFEQCLK